MFGAREKSQRRNGVFGTCFKTFCSRVTLQPGCVACLRVSFGGNCLRLRIARFHARPPTRSEPALRLTRSRSCFPDADCRARGGLARQVVPAFASSVRGRRPKATGQLPARRCCQRPAASASVLPATISSGVGFPRLDGALAWAREDAPPLEHLVQACRAEPRAEVVEEVGRRRPRGRSGA